MYLSNLMVAKRKFDIKCSANTKSGQCSSRINVCSASNFHKSSLDVTGAGLEEKPGPLVAAAVAALAAAVAAAMRPPPARPAAVAALAAPDTAPETRDPMFVRALTFPKAVAAKPEPLAVLVGAAGVSVAELSMTPMDWAIEVSIKST
ncbi:hypothetical protein T265_05211 [Opisthorchis viverrini]|uniref:Uncharacterized protein n=1 Tax=Opisthorchis viverrini TaxID=6198 RepID=A0A074ZKK1_OPIVI|nr:hypothetical protein T265_05211 [Opisthorchis viverrini]KER27858.1 hypothetical protein T265_05211 [Opisthorchis viverrini]